MAAPVMLKRPATKAFSEPQSEMMRQSELNGGSINLSELNNGMSLEELDAHIQRSPIKMLNTVARSRPLKKMRRDNVDYVNGNGDVVTDQSDNSSSPEPHPELVVDLPMNDHTSKIRAEVEDAIPKVNGHRNFPCVWLDGSDPLRNPEGGDISPQSQTPLDYADSPPVTTPPSAPVSATVNGLMSAVSGKVSGNVNKVVSSGVINGQVAAIVIEPKSAATPKGPAMPQNHTPNNTHFGSALGITPGITPMKGPPALLSLVAESGTDVPSSDSEVSEVVVEAVPSEVCPECRKVFKRRVYLQRHMEREHWSTAKVFKCDDCSYETKHQSNLSVHRRTHTGERPYHCGACGQRYTQGHLLKSHIRSRHAGNMQFYNLEKKSDSTRGRKSLDPKHDHLSSLAGGLGHKQDKISALLAAASNGGQCPPQQSQQHSMRFGRLLSPATINQYMNTLSPFPIRHMMSPPVALAGGLLMTPQLFALGGVPGGLPAIGSAMLPGTLRQGMPMLSTATTAAMAQQSGIATTAMTANTGIKIPLKIPEIPNPSGSASFFPANLFSAVGGGSVFPSGGSSDDFSPKIRELSSDDEIAVPEDLSTKKTAAMEDKMVTMVTNTEKAIPQEAAPQDLSNYSKYDHLRAASSPCSEQAVISHALPRQNGVCEPFYHSDASTMTETCCADMTTRCPHRRELRQLRRNILRMLSVFTPELNIENGIDCNSNQVDQLLHEVIYSNDDDDAIVANGNTSTSGSKG